MNPKQSVFDMKPMTDEQKKDADKFFAAQFEKGDIQEEYRQKQVRRLCKEIRELCAKRSFAATACSACQCGCTLFVWWVAEHQKWSSPTPAECYSPQRHPRAHCKRCDRVWQNEKGDSQSLGK